MNLHAIYHIPEVPYAYSIDDNKLFIKLRVANNDVKKVNLYYKDRYEWRHEFKISEMKKVSETELFDFFEYTVSVAEGRVKYFFEIEGLDGTIIYFNERGTFKEKPEELGDFQYPYINSDEIYEDVKWTNESVVYQIFPDRFCNGNKDNDLYGTEKWGDKVKSKSFFGGDIKGVLDKVNYLDDLGINIVYLTPIFKSSSNHKYNTEDYFEIDESFGTKEEFRKLVEELHKRDIKIILDAVFNHSGDDFFAFKHIKKNGINSKYKDWYFINGEEIEDSINYRTFGNKLKYMPKLNMENEETKEYFLNVGTYWIKEFNIDGWRLDVSDEVSHTFWKAFRKTVKRVNKDIFIIGEIMHEGKTFLKGDEFDSSMNYPFREACLDFFAYRSINAKELLDRVIMRKEGLRRDIYSQMLNLLDSHDTKRFLTECSEDIKRLMLATVFQFTSEGIPYIYYGDEVGLSGGNDPDCRKCMIWNEKDQNKQLLSHYKKLIKIRKENNALMVGEYEEVYSKGKLLIYKRILCNEEILIVINNEEEKQKIDLNIFGEFNDMYLDETIKIDGELEINGMDFKILK
ncbi:MAG: glycoside hydrolase family 13 protein [Clostridium sp.]